MDQRANVVQGYLPHGSAAYQDGYIVSRSGQSWYERRRRQERERTFGH